MDISEYTTVGEVAAAVGRVQQTVTHHIRAGNLPGAVTVGTGRHAVHLVPKMYLDPVVYAATVGGRRRGLDSGPGRAENQPSRHRAEE